jgi:hypothetical protein
MLLVFAAEAVVKAKTLKEAYHTIMRAANVEGVNLPPYDEFKRQIEELDGKQAEK